MDIRGKRESERVEDRRNTGIFNPAWKDDYTLEPGFWPSEFRYTNPQAAYMNDFFNNLEETLRAEKRPPVPKPRPDQKDQRKKK